MLKIVCYGDSNTFGYKPYGNRYLNPYPVILQKLLGNNYKVFNEGLNGRTSIYKARFYERVGINTVNDLLEYNHIDYLIFMLGTNDLKIGNANTIDDLYNGLDLLLDKITKLNIIDNFIFISPILLGKDVEVTDIEFNYHSYKLSLSLYDIYKRLSDKYKPCLLIDAKEYITPTIDNEHFPEEGHNILASILANYFLK